MLLGVGRSPAVRGGGRAAEALRDRV